MQETQFCSLGWDNPLDKEMATHSNILAWKIPWTEEPGGLQSKGSQSDMIEHTHTHTHTFEKVIMDRVLFNVLHVLTQSSQ